MNLQYNGQEQIPADPAAVWTFVKDPDFKVGKYVESKGGKVVSFVRFEVGEGMEKREENFAEEVMNQLKK